MSPLRLIKASLEDIPQIKQLADTVWNQHYPDVITVEQIEYMLDRMYSADTLTKQMMEEGHDFYLIENNKKTIGFIGVSRLKKRGEFMVNKFYLLQNLAAKGLGTKAFKALIRILKPVKLQLTVNRKNHKSINFYFKNDFKIESIADFDIGGNFFMNDFVMVWKKK